MITVPTHKHQKIPFKHSKTIYVFTSGRVIVIVQIQSRKKKRFKGLKWPLQKEPSILESSRICPILLQDLMKRGVCRRCGGDARRAGARIKPKFPPLRSTLKINDLRLTVLWKVHTWLDGRSKHFLNSFKQSIFYLTMWWQLKDL
jgi:hypothetical protein